MKKLIALVLALALVMATCAVAFADDPVEGVKFTYTGTDATTSGKIAMTNATKDVTYTLYKIFDATYNASGNVAYTIKAGALKTALEGNADIAQYFVIATNADSNGNYAVTRAGTTSGGTFSPTKTDAELIAFIKTFATNFTRIGAIKASAQGTIEWEKIPYGYYYISPDQPVSDAAVTIDSNTPTVSVIDKNQSIPTPDKQEMVEAGTWKYEGIGATENPVPSAKVGDTVNYKVVGSFTQYVGTDVVKALKFKDTMSNGLTADQNVAIKINNTTLTTYNKIVNGGTAVKVGEGDTIQFTVTYTENNNGTDADATDDYWVTDIVIPTATVSGNDVTFLYNANNTYEITYSAKIDKDAVIDGEDQNTVDLKYSDKNDNDHDVGSDTTKVKNFKFDLVKLDGAGKALTGAEFKLWADSNKTTQINLVEVTAGSVYRVADATETTANAIITAGTVVIKGLKTGSYWLEETKAPAGYNKLQNLIEVKIENADKEATFYAASDLIEGKEVGDYKEGGVSVINQQGTELPSTGGIGTTIFYIVGGLLVIGAAVILVARRKAHE